MKSFIFQNTNNSIAVTCLKSLHQLESVESDYNVVFDREYDILVNDKKISRKFYTLDDRHIYDNILSKSECILLEFDLDFTCDPATSYREYIAKKLGIEFSEAPLPPLDVYTTTEQIVNAQKLITDSNKHNFSNVLFAPFNLDISYYNFKRFDNAFYDLTLSSFTPESANSIYDFLDKKVNIIQILPTQDKEFNLSELYYLVQEVDYVISNLDILHVIAHDLKKPSFLNLGRFTKYYQKSSFCTIYDPQRNVKKALPSKLFRKNYEHVLGYNNQILSENIEEIKKEIIQSFDKHKIAYK